MKGFLLAAVKIAVGLVLAIIVLSLLGWGVYAFNEYRVEKQNADLAKARQWPDLTQQSLKATFKLKTIWRDGRMQYQFRVVGYSEIIGAAHKKGTLSFTLLLVDADGFDLNSETVELKAMTLLVDNEGKEGGLEAQGSSYMSAENYRRAAKWNATWRGIGR